MKYKMYTIREIKNIMQKNGYKKVRQTGSHATYENTEGIHITISLNNNNNPLIMRRLIKENNLKEDF